MLLQLLQSLMSGLVLCFDDLFPWRHNDQWWYWCIHHCVCFINVMLDDSQNRRWFANRWNRTAAGFCDHSIRLKRCTKPLIMKLFLKRRSLVRFRSKVFGVKLKIKDKRVCVVCIFCNRFSFVVYITYNKQWPNMTYVNVPILEVNLA